MLRKPHSLSNRQSAPWLTRFLELVETIPSLEPRGVHCPRWNPHVKGCIHEFVTPTVYCTLERFSEVSDQLRDTFVEGEINPAGWLLTTE